LSGMTQSTAASAEIARVGGKINREIFPGVRRLLPRNASRWHGRILGVMNHARLLLTGSLALLISGCANGLYFGTKTKWGLEATGTATAPVSVGLTYHRGEAVVIPENEAGRTYSVFGGSDNDFSWFNGLAVSQRFATGDAAVIAAGGTVEENEKTNDAQHGKLVFTTGTTFGLDLRYSSSAAQSPGLLAGYRREEGVFIPTKPSAVEANSVYADISIVYSPDGDAAKLDAIEPDRRPRLSGGARIKQRFATGAAARLVAKDDAAKNKLRKAAGLAPGVSIADAQTVKARLRRVTDPDKQAQLLAIAKDVSLRHEMPGPHDFTELSNSWPGYVSEDALEAFLEEAGSLLPQ
jgi:hypothetical protein